ARHRLPLLGQSGTATGRHTAHPRAASRGGRGDVGPWIAASPGPRPDAPGDHPHAQRSLSRRPAEEPEAVVPPGRPRADPTRPRHRVRPWSERAPPDRPRWRRAPPRAGRERPAGAGPGPGTDGTGAGGGPAGTAAPGTSPERRPRTLVVQAEHLFQAHLVADRERTAA